MARISGKSGNVYVGLQTVFDAESAMDEQVIANVTQTADSTIWREGAASSKLAVAAGFTTGIVGSKAVGPLDLTAYTQLLLWYRTSVALSAADWSILLDDTALCASPLEDIEIPAQATVDTWKYILLTLDTPSALTAVISVGLRQNVDKGAMNFWIDRVWAAKATVGIKSWSLDKKINVLDATAFDSVGVREFVVGDSQWQGIFEGYKTAAPLAIGSLVGLSLSEGPSGGLWDGVVEITNLKAKTDIDGLVSYAYDFQGTFELTPSAA